MSIDTLKAQAYHHIRERLLVGGWPVDASLSYNKLAKNIGTSCTPVREAVIQLESEGLLEKHELFGIRPKQLHRTDIEELFELRISLEGGAAKIAAEKITADELMILGDILERNRAMLKDFITNVPNAGVPVDRPTVWRERMAVNNLDIYTINVEFHTRLLTAAKNARIMKILSNLHILTQLLRGHVIMPGDTLSGPLLREYRFHAKIFQALRNRDGVAARDWMDRHLLNARQHHLAVYDLRRQLTSLGATLADEYPERIVTQAEKIETDILNTSTLDE